jgi:hypothetical protein
MTVRESYENILIELNKQKSPHLHLEDFIYYLNKAIQEYVNERYNMFEVNQQLSDDLSALKASVVCTIAGANATYAGSFSGVKAVSTLKRYNSNAINLQMPDDYMHVLNCIVNIRANFPYKCHPAGYIHSEVAKRLTSDQAAGVLNNAFLKPDIKRPYHQIVDGSNGSVISDLYVIYGGQDMLYTLTEFSVDYIKKPQTVSLTVAERDAIIDTSATLEFSDYVCNEIIKRALKLILENSSNPRLQTHIPVNKSIA